MYMIDGVKLLKLKKQVLSNYLNENEKHIFQQIDNDYTRFVVSNVKKINRIYDVYTKDEREVHIKRDIENLSLTIMWEFDLDTIKKILNIKQSDFENYIIAEKIVNPDFHIKKLEYINGVMVGIVEGSSIKGLVQNTIGELEFYKRLYNWLDKNNGIFKILSNYDHEEVKLNDLYIYRVS